LCHEPIVPEYRHPTEALNLANMNLENPPEQDIDPNDKDQEEVDQTTPNGDRNYQYDKSPQENIETNGTLSPAPDSIQLGTPVRNVNPIPLRARLNPILKRRDLTIVPRNLMKTKWADGYQPAVHRFNTRSQPKP
jgi:hypothetical protein